MSFNLKNLKLYWSSLWAVLYFEMWPVEVQVKLYVEPFDAFFSFSFPFMQWIWDIYWIKYQYHIIIFAKFQISFCDFHLFPHRIFPSKEDLVETALIESLLHQLYLHCEGEARGGQSQSVPHFISVWNWLSEWALESSTAPRVTETMLRNARLVVVPTDGWAFSWQLGPGNAVIIWKYNSFTCCTHPPGQPGHRSLVQLYQWALNWILTQLKVSFKIMVSWLSRLKSLTRLSAWR